MTGGNLNKSLKKILGVEPSTAKDAVCALVAQQDALGSSELEVQFLETDESGCTIYFLTEKGESSKVQIWADPKFDDLLHLACPLIQLREVDLNKSQIWSQDAMFSYLTDRQGENLALVHTLDTKAGFPLETVLGVAWALTVYSDTPSEFLKKEKN